MSMDLSPSKQSLISDEIIECILAGSVSAATIGAILSGIVLKLSLTDKCNFDNSSFNWSKGTNFLF